MKYLREIFPIIRFEAKLLPQDAPGLQKGDTWDFTMLIQADAELLGGRIESFHNVR